MGKEAEIDIVFFPSGEIRTISSDMINSIFIREQNIESVTMSPSVKERYSLGIRWNHEFDEWTVSDFKMRLFIELTEVKFKSS